MVLRARAGFVCVAIAWWEYAIALLATLIREGTLQTAARDLQSGLRFRKARKAPVRAALWSRFSHTSCKKPRRAKLFDTKPS